MSGEQDQHNKGGLYAFIFSMVFVFAFMFYLVCIHPGVNLDEKVVDPATLKNQPQKPAYDITKNAEPWVSNPDLVEYGHKVFDQNCALCHGKEGKGDGPGGAGLKPPPRNFVEGKWTQGAGIIAHFKVVTNGIPGSSMAAWKQLKVGDRWAVVNFIESITSNPGHDDPAKVAAFAKTAQ